MHQNVKPRWTNVTGTHYLVEYPNWFPSIHFVTYTKCHRFWAVPIGLGSSQRLIRFACEKSCSTVFGGIRLIWWRFPSENSATMGAPGQWEKLDASGRIGVQFIINSQPWQFESWSFDSQSTAPGIKLSPAGKHWNRDELVIRTG